MKGRFVCSFCNIEFEGIRDAKRLNYFCSVEHANAFRFGKDQKEILNPKSRGKKKILCLCGKYMDSRSKTCLDCRPDTNSSDIENENYINIIMESNSFKEASRNSGKSVYFLRDLSIKRKLDISHMSWFLSEENLLRDRTNLKNQKRRNARVKKYIIDNNLIEYKCKCGITDEWQGVYISLELEHKNGNFLDDRLENLEFLCPNCHSQTETYKWKNKKV